MTSVSLPPVTDSKYRSFIAHQSHDLANILAGLYLRMESLRGKVATTITGIVEESAVIDAEQMATLLNEIGLIQGSIGTMVGIVAAIRDGKAELDKKVTSIDAIIREVICTLSDDQPPHVQIDFTGGVVLAEVDRVAIWSAVYNLVANAKSILQDKMIADKNTKGVIQITTESIDGMVHIKVNDNGPGVPEDIKEKLFREGTTTKDGEGHGYGLENVRKYAEGHGGLARCESVPGNTTFTITVLEGDIKKLQDRGARENADKDLLKDTVVLLLDDDETIREVLPLMLGIFGPKAVEVCCDMKSLVDKLKDIKLDPEINLFAILDDEFPGGNAREAQSEVMKMFPMAQCVFHSGNSGNGNSEQHIRTFKYSLKKPATMQDLMATLKQCLRATVFKEDKMGRPQ